MAEICETIFVKEELFPSIDIFLIFPFNTESTSEASFTLKTSLFDNFTSDAALIKDGPLILYNIVGIIMSNVNSTIILINEDDENKESTLKSIHLIMEFLLLAGFPNNTACYQDLYSNKFSIQTNVTDAIMYLIGPIFSDFQLSPCLSILPGDLYEEMEEYYKNNRTTINKLWPTCLINMFVALGENEGKVTDWSFLSQQCKIQEIALLCCSFSITFNHNSWKYICVDNIGGLWPNKKEVLHDPIFLCPQPIYSWALFLLLWQYIIHIRLMTGWLTLSDLDPEGTYASFSKLKSQQTDGFPTAEI